MNDFEKRISVRIEKAAEQTLQDRLGAVDWEKMPVDKMVKGTILAILAWKLGVPAVFATLRIIKWFFIVIACFLLLSVCRIMTTPPAGEYLNGSGNYVKPPRAELVNPYPHHR